jgi:hypothetical protein
VIDRGIAKPKQAVLAAAMETTPSSLQEPGLRLKAVAPLIAHEQPPRD